MQAGDVDRMRECLDEKNVADLLLADPGGLTTALHLCCKTRNVPAVKLLLEAGADPDFLQHNPDLSMRFSALCSTNDAEIARLLLAGGADVQGGGASVTPLYLACEGGRSPVVEMLLLAGALVDEGSGEGWTTEDGWSPLFTACQYVRYPGLPNRQDEYVSCVRLLLRFGAAIDAALKD